jgi:hypothetical protein
MYGYDNAYSDQPGDYGMPDMSNGSGGPTGVPDPNNPGYDTAGYPLPGGRTAPPTANVPPPGNVPVNGAPNVTQPPPSDTGGGGLPPPPPPPAPPDPSSGALAQFSEPAPQYPTQPAYVGTQFKAPTMADALNDPGAQARWQRGQESLQNWAAARGTLNDTDTAKMLLDYGQNSEAQDYGNVYARQFGTWQGNEQQAQQQYGINRQTQAIDPWTAAYNEWVQKGNFYLNNQGTVANTALGFARL